MQKYALELTDIVKKYQDGDEMVTVLDQVSMKVRPGEFVAIVGPSGSGKSTLLSIAGALLSPTEGSCRIGEIDVTKKSQKEWTKIRKDHIGFIFQTHQLLPFLNVKEQLTMMAKLSSNKKDKASMDYCEELLTDLGLSESLEKFPNQLSGGQRQRVAIARAFVNHPDVILADEPTASLDGERGRQVVDMIRSEVKKHGKAAVMVTHDERVLDLVDTVYRIENGKIICEKATLTH